MSMLPLTGMALPIREAMTLARRAVAALERQAELMAEPEVVDKVEDQEQQISLQKANGAGYLQAKSFFGQKLEDILDGGFATDERAKKLRMLSETMNGPKKSNKK